DGVIVTSHSIQLVAQGPLARHGDVFLAAMILVSRRKEWINNLAWVTFITIVHTQCCQAFRTPTNTRSQTVAAFFVRIELRIEVDRESIGQSGTGTDQIVGTSAGTRFFIAQCYGLLIKIQALSGLQNKTLEARYRIQPDGRQADGDRVRLA